MVQAVVKITNHNGIHLKPASELCKIAMKYTSDVKIKREDGEYNAKSIISLLSSCTKAGDELTVICEGEDEQEALDNIIDFINNADW